jgi:cobyrinic acid a,c-diamide synthase
VTARALIIAAPRSGCGKTTVALALIAALARRGMAVRAIKAGPDYIDAGFHAAASAAQVFNFDSWAMPPALLDAVMTEAAAGADIVVIEGAMGLFDGVAGPPGRCGTTADLAIHFRLPVILVVDISGQAQSAAAVARGFTSHHAEVRIAAVVLNRSAGERHRGLAVEAISALDVPIFGAIPRDDALALPQRHLGLVQASEHRDLAERLDRLSQLAEQHLDIEAILAIAATPKNSVPHAALPLPPPGQRIALARDGAFTFMYEHVLQGWRRAGAEIVPFSPLADEPPPEDCDSCWLSGGYPELHAGALAGAQRFRSGLARFAATRRVHGECGGYMVLGQGIEDATGALHAMTGLLGHATSFAKPKLHLGYRQARLLCDSAVGNAGDTVRGHEFHYASLTARGADEPFSELADSQGRALGQSGGRRGMVTGTFFHAITRVI